MLEYDRSTHLIRRHVTAKAMRCDLVGGRTSRDRIEALRRRATMAVAENQSRNDQNLLKRSLAAHPAAAEVLTRLQACGPDQRCGSAACAVCITATSLVTVPLVSDLIGGHPGPWFYLTIIHTRPTIPQGQLPQHRLFDDFEAKLHTSFDEHGTIAVGTLEISCNEHHADAHGPRYVEHAHIFTPMDITQKIRRRLLDYFPRTNGVKRPLKACPYDRSDDAIDYGLKTHVVRRIQLPPTRPDGTRTIFSTRKRRLRGPQRVEVAIATYRRAATDQLFVHGIHVVETGNEVRLEADDDHA